jgi:hypothetical protein
VKEQFYRMLAEIAQARTEAELGALSQRASRGLSSVSAKAARVAIQERRGALARLRPLRLLLVGCGKQKAQEPRLARDLYTGPLFVSARRYVERVQAHDDRALWLILSAKHGLVHPLRELEPYDEVLPGSKKAQSEWADRVSAALLELLRWERMRGVLVRAEILASHRYAAPLRPLLESNGIDVKTPLEGLGLGARRAWLARAPVEG